MTGGKRSGGLWSAVLALAVMIAVFATIAFGVWQVFQDRRIICQKTGGEYVTQGVYSVCLPKWMKP